MELARSSDSQLTKVGQFVLRYSLVFFFLSFGSLKFTKGEAEGIVPMMAGSIGMSWVTPTLGVRGGSDVIGVIEIACGLMVALRPLSAWLCFIGSLGLAFALLNTVSFLFTMKGLDYQSADAGFLMKDLTLFGAALWSAGEACTAAGGFGRSAGQVAAPQPTSLS